MSGLLMSTAGLFLHNTWSVLGELAPWLFLGAAVSGLLHVLLPPGFIHRQLNGNFGVFKAVALGVPMPLCSCGVIPTGIGLKQDGASNGASVGFITATPQTGVDSILVSASFLGWPFALTKVAAALVTGMVSGLATNLVSPSNADSAPTATDSCAIPKPRTARAALDHAIELIQMIWGWLLFGVLLSAALSTWLPSDFFAGLATTSTIAAFGVVLLASVPLYVCATASVPIAAALVAAGMPTGAAMVFLMAGPATNVATLGAVYRAFGSRTLAVYLITLIVGSVAFGLGYEALFGTLAVGHVHDHVHTTPWWGHGSAVVLVGLIGWFAWLDWQSFRARRAMQRKSGETIMTGKTAPTPIVVGVGGMTCGGCSSRLERLLQKESGVDSAVVSLEEARAKVVGTVELARIREIVENAGFEFTG